MQKVGFGLNEAVFILLSSLNINDLQIIEELDPKVKLVLPRSSINKLSGYETKEIPLTLKKAIFKLSLDTVEKSLEFSYFASPLFYHLSFLFTFFDRLTSRDGLIILTGALTVGIGEMLREIYVNRFQNKLEDFLPFLPKQKASMPSNQISKEDFST